jgi:hypothetical protein
VTRESGPEIEEDRKAPPFPFPVPKSDFSQARDPGKTHPSAVVKSLPKIAAPFAPEDAIAAPAPKKEMLKASHKGFKPPKILESKRAKEKMQGKPIQSEEIGEDPAGDSQLRLQKRKGPAVSEPVEVLPAPKDEFDPEPPQVAKEEKRADLVEDSTKPSAKGEGVAQMSGTQGGSEGKEEQKPAPVLNWTAPEPVEKLNEPQSDQQNQAPPEVARQPKSPLSGTSGKRADSTNIETAQRPKEKIPSPKNPPTLNWTAPDKPVESMAPETAKEDEPAAEPMRPPEGKESTALSTPSEIEEQSIPDNLAPGDVEEDIPVQVSPPPAPPKEMVPSPLEPGALEDEEVRDYLKATAAILEELSLLMTRAPSLTLAQYDPSDSSAPLAPAEVLRQIESLSRRLRILDSKTFTVIPPNRYNEFHNMLRNSIAESRMAFEAVMNFFSQGDPNALRQMRKHITKARDLIRETRRRS